MRDAQIAVRKADIRRCVQAVAQGESQTLAINLDEDGVDIATLICEVTAKLQRGSPALERLLAAFELTSNSDRLIHRLTSTDSGLQAKSARIVGALRMEQALPWLTPLLAARQRAVRDAAARAVGRIGGARSAEALMIAIRRSGPSAALMVELARAAPDLFLESALTRPRGSGTRYAVAAAAGLRRRRSAARPLIALLASGSRRERAISCKALGWIGDRSAVPAISAALGDREQKVRTSAEKALIALFANATAGPLIATHARGER
jgi:HEAT repeat protein